MSHRTVHAIPALAPVLATGVLAVGIAVAGCAATTAAATPAAGAASARPATSAATPAASTSAPVYGPAVPDPACVAARRAEQTMQARQGKDASSQSALDKDFTNFASALNAAAQQETHPAAATAMTALANDYTALVESQSGAQPLPSMSAVQNDGAAFDKACP
jgi:hypothetical protein